MTRAVVYSALLGALVVTAAASLGAEDKPAPAKKATIEDVEKLRGKGDVVIEYADQGNDSVYSTIDYTLAANVENLFMSGKDNTLSRLPYLDVPRPQPPPSCMWLLPAIPLQ